MPTLKADNRQLVKNAKFSYLSTNYASGVSSIVVTNSAGFSANDYVVLGEFGHESTEVVQVSTVTAGTHTLALSAATKFPHPESTRATVIQYNQVRFYHTTTATFATSDPVSTYLDLEADAFFTRKIDSTYSSGFGWFVFYNSTSASTSANSNAIPYGGFDEESVKKIFDAFWSLLNNKEQKLINTDDAFRWLNEGYSITKNELNLVNPEYSVPAQEEISILSGTAEYDLETDASNLVSVTDGNGDDIPYATLQKVHYMKQNASGQRTHYYLRNKKIGFVPTPTSDTTFYYYYRQKTTKLTSYYDSVDLPDNNFYFLVDFMMYRASQKLTRPNPEQHLKLFEAGVNRMKVTSNKQNANLDSFEPADESIV